MALGTDNAAPLIPGGILVSDPDGMPEGATGFIDFVSGTYYFGENLTVDDVFGIPEGSVHYTSGIAPEDLSENGWEPTTAEVGFIGPLLAQVLAGATCVVDMVITGNTSATSYFEFGLPHDFDPYPVALLNTASGGAGISPDAFNDVSVPFVPSTTPAGRHKMAATFIPSNSIAASLDGAAVISDATAWAATPDEAGIKVAVQPGTYISSITIHPVQDNADLPALSAL